uniref:Uncharacterized protein MANES_15G157200 n=1 Tax=Rhizophora mucronata TaxID=61149 RepID=A0A2P2KBK7_RHIMU
MLNSSTVFWVLVLGDEKPRFGSARIARVAKKTAGVPCKREIKQLEASGRVLEVQLRKTIK